MKWVRVTYVKVLGHHHSPRGNIYSNLENLFRVLIPADKNMLGTMTRSPIHQRDGGTLPSQSCQSFPAGSKLKEYAIPV